MPFISHERHLYKNNMKNIPLNIDLNQPLPGALYESKKARFTSYRSFAVFSRPWIARRTGWAVFWFAILTVTLVFTMQKDQPTIAAMLAIIGLINIKIFLLFCLGPIAAFFARQRYSNTAAEKQKTLIALIVGMVLAVLIVLVAVDTPRDRIVQDVFRNSPVNSSLATSRTVAYADQGRYIDLATNLVLVCLFGGGFAGFSYIREYRRRLQVTQEQTMQKLETEKLTADSKLAVLQAQVEPHFLFNSLASVRALVVQDPKRAQASIDALVTYLRATIPQMRAEQDSRVLSTVAQQVHLASAYLDVMAHRMGERLRVEVDVPITLSDAPFPPLLLISLVENAVKHGAEPHAGITTISISVGTLSETQLFVRVTDDGAGLVPQAHSGIGLANIRAQLAARFGNVASLNLRQGADAKGVVAEIIIPKE
jgi:sensor histidine kinase YesM